MDNQEIINQVKTVKQKIESMIEAGHLLESSTLLDQLEEAVSGDPDVYSMRAVIHIIEGRIDIAEAILAEGLKKDSVHFDLLFNLAYIYEMKGAYQKAADIYCKAGTAAFSETQKQNLGQALERIRNYGSGVVIKEKEKVVFFVKEGMDSFLGDIIERLDEEFWTRKIIVRDFIQIDEGMRWADVCWFEWCDELLDYGSKLPLAGKKKIICRIHGYEVYTNFIINVAWKNVDQLIIVAPHIKRIFEERIREVYNGNIKIDLVFCSLNIDKYPVTKRSKGYNLGYIGNINYKKNIPMTLDIFKKLHDSDSRYKLYFAGRSQDVRTFAYIEYFIREYDLADSVIFDGWLNYEQKVEWFKKIDYMLISSIDEGLCYAAAEAMCSGIKPILHNCEGIKDHYDTRYIFNSVDDAVGMISSAEYDSLEYRDFIVKHYSLDREIDQIKSHIRNLLSFKEFFGKVEQIVTNDIKIDEKLHHDLTVLIPCFNRAKMIKEDLDRGLKLGNQAKLIVDDCSTSEREWLDLLEKSYSDKEVRIIRKETNSGVAESRRIGFEVIDSKYMTFIDDDNMMLCLNKSDTLRDMSGLTNEISLVIPRYVINCYKANLTIGYDRQCYEGMSGEQILKDIAASGEMYMLLTGGAIGETKWMAGLSSAALFTCAGEDFVMLSRMMADRPKDRIKVTEGLVFIRRFLEDGLTMKPSPLKVMLSLCSQAIACYYCLKLGVANKNQVSGWMMDRAKLIQKVHNFGESFGTDLIAYLKGDVEQETFTQLLRSNGISLNKGLSQLAPELPGMRELFQADSI